MGMEHFHVHQIIEALPDDFPAPWRRVQWNGAAKPTGHISFVGQEFIQPHVVVAVLMGNEYGTHFICFMFRELVTCIRAAVDEDITLSGKKKRGPGAFLTTAMHLLADEAIAVELGKTPGPASTEKCQFHGNQAEISFNPPKAMAHMAARWNTCFSM